MNDQGMIIHNYVCVQKISLLHGNRPHCPIVALNTEKCVQLRNYCQKRTVMYTKKLVFYTCLPIFVSIWMYIFGKVYTNEPKGKKGQCLRIEVVFRFQSIFRLMSCWLQTLITVFGE